MWERERVGDDRRSKYGFPSDLYMLLGFFPPCERRIVMGETPGDDMRENRVDRGGDTYRAGATEARGTLANTAVTRREQQVEADD
ncbi:hypothetical protein EYF80_047050 [Liparis tanakae]|uniref:Uncharacterized protein n=1 Tax=Liparis tanakae TaxID=230148 RepID=A0A4Z2FPR2_9TELE|nr:hypothetical protein EYF80_047050 [Liparis tanakae]